ncbi:MAG: hydrogenase maturation protease [Acidobacteriota bacterium]|jgi:hydrogenase maturation protease|nr:hydrogenase maturation protease [Acidobacteriota bacterium]
MGGGGTLVLGWGNPARRDDGLGPAFAEGVAGFALPAVAAESPYQLEVEYAAEVARYERVLFADADRSGPAPFWVRRLAPASIAPSFSSHSIAPGAVLALARDLFGAAPEAWLLGIRGYEFEDFREGLSPAARTNLDAALAYAARTLGSGVLEEYPEGLRDAAAHNPAAACER